jgi:hypothetical protein
VRMACALGWYAEADAAEMYSCVPCGLGSYKDSIRTARCSLCLPGTFQNETGSSGCHICPFNLSHGMSSCEATFSSPLPSTPPPPPLSSPPPSSPPPPPPGRPLPGPREVIPGKKGERGQKGGGEGEPNFVEANQPPGKGSKKDQLLAKSQGRTSEGSRRLLNSQNVSMIVALPVPDALDDLSHWLCGRGSAQALPHNNDAAYGPCVATMYSTLEFKRGPFHEPQGFQGRSSLFYSTTPGTHVKVTVVKNDRYGQTMASDSSSSLQLHSALKGERKNDPSVSFTGSVFSGLREGKAEFSLGVVPAFTVFSDDPGSTELLSQPHVYVTGADVDDVSGILMQSDVYQVRLRANELVCDRSSVLKLDSERYYSEMGTGRSGQCIECEAGKYSINPLTGEVNPGNRRGDVLPGCLTCPAGGECFGGSITRFKRGTWSSDNRRYFLKSCPTGHKVINMTTEGINANVFSHDIQECRQCDKGEECTAKQCEICTQCAPGYYKSAVSTDPCVACPANTYRETTGSSDLGDCEGCQVKSSTLGLTGRRSRRACACDIEYYLIMSDEGTAEEALSCQACPKGAKCGDGECALRNQNFNCTDGSSIVGQWLINSETGQYELASCPAGYELQTTQETGSPDLQQCLKCQPPSQYIVQPDLDSCQACPPGLTCHGDATLDPVVLGSKWAIFGAIFRLQSCPSGYYVSPRASEALNAAQQRCLPCGKGSECIAPSCTVCSQCATGSYKSSISTEACTACPENTYGDETLERTLPAYCRACPKGGQCKDRSCGLRKTPFTCKLVGEWVLDIASSEYHLVACPTGSKLLNSSGHDNQECQQCAENYYVMNSRDPHDVCRKCPSGALLAIES